MIKKGGYAMQRAIFSKIDLSDPNDTLANEYIHCIHDLLQIDEIQKLKNYSQHMNTTRFQHSVNVSYYTFLIARKLGLDACSAARAGILHDFYFYDWRDIEKNDRPIEGRHCSVHPQIALENARKVTKINAIMEDAIVHHMWPMTLRMPKTKEGWLLQAVDKYCAVSEVLLQGSHKLRYSQTVISLMLLLSFVTV